MRAVLVLAAVLVAGVPVAAGAQDGRPIFNLKSLLKQQYEVAQREDLKGIGQGLTLVVMALPLPEAEGQGKGLERIQRLYVLDGDRVVFDSFTFDRIPETSEPSVNSPTFFGLQWAVQKGAKAKDGVLILKGLRPLQDPGEPVRTGHRILVLSYGAGGFDPVVDAVSARPATLTPTEVKVPLGGEGR
jgi:hypothetical protein